MGRRPRVRCRRCAIGVVERPEPERCRPPMEARRCGRRWPRGARRRPGGARPRSPVPMGTGHDDGLRSHVECHPSGNCTGLALGDAHERACLHRRRARSFPRLAGRRVLPRRQALLAPVVIRRVCSDCGDVPGRRLLLRTTRLPPGGAAHSPFRGPRLRRVYRHVDLCPVQPEFHLDGDPVFRSFWTRDLLHPHPRRSGRLCDSLRAVRADSSRARPSAN